MVGKIIHKLHVHKKNTAKGEKSAQFITVKILTAVMLLVVPLNLLAILSSIQLLGRYFEQTELGMKNITDVYMNTIDFYSEKADLFLYDFLNEDALCTVLKNSSPGQPDYENALYQSYTYLSGQMQQEDVISGYFLFPGESGDSVMALERKLQNSQGKIREYILTVGDSDNRWHIAVIDGQNMLLRVARDAYFCYGALIDLGSQQEKIMEQGNYESLNVLFTETETEREGTRVYAETKSDRSDLLLRVDVSRSECLRGVSVWSRLLLGMSGVFVLSVPVLYFYLRKLIVKPLEKLNQAFEKVEWEEQACRIAEEADTREFQEAFHSFNRMVDNMSTLYRDNIKKELEKNRLELDNLKLQIRPHFLLNSFNLMYYLLRSRERTDAAREMILYLSDYFRYLFRSDQDLELFDKELTLIGEYVKVAGFRYPKGLEIVYDIDPEVRLVRVPPLLIHNFVENVVKHALSRGKCVHILLEARYDAGQVCFEISDDGCGMEEEMVKAINERSWKTEEKHLGIRNSIRRLEYLYGKEADLRVWSKPGEGTVFTITFPYELEMEE